LVQDLKVQKKRRMVKAFVERKAEDLRIEVKDSLKESESSRRLKMICDARYRGE
jgi:hypothetical protein